MNTIHIRPVLFATLSALSLGMEISRAQNTAFTYQGRVLDNGANFSGTGQFKFALVTSTNAASQATATAITSGGFLTAIKPTCGGAGCTPPPPLTISCGSSSNAATPA